MVSVIPAPVSCTNPGHTSSQITAYKHTISGSSKLTGIKFYLNGDQGQRRRITSRNLGLPIEGPVDVYAFYCTEDPILVYVNSTGGSSQTIGWYRKSKRSYDKNWTKIPTALNGITPTNITECRNWNKLVGVLEGLKCHKFNKCTYKSSLGRADDGVQEEVIDLGLSEPEAPDSPRAEAHGGQASSPASNTGGAIAGYVLTGVCVISGSLTGFAYWLYKRTNGDPWVRHGYSIECLKNVPY
ncbi:hypothetical protein BEWA_016180 [Theileria equi strain WA]|uniref:Uncharacterized protein n=1 Tax=Theileria equi strain WA TaxID=1537102 RepID=L1LC80_THEEQ|nr:hypothetical protein BEWA_016180 [Theileria equi strain WA]EKX73057.1 hypothetical protein BEWA_016180 [Theileria equi strain WA]|eukprot:XP_004832509.1 hypothetical protein BEWA_016180 [Theileria equi strain WA]